MMKGNKGKQINHTLKINITGREYNKQKKKTKRNRNGKMKWMAAIATSK